MGQSSIRTLTPRQPSVHSADAHAPCARASASSPSASPTSRSRRFYEALGLVVTQAVEGEVVFFQLAGGVVLALYPRALLLRYARIRDAHAADGFGGISLAQNTRSQAEVDAILADAERAGAASVTPGATTSCGGYVGYFTDPDGHLWEIAWNPGFALDPSGGIVPKTADLRAPESAGGFGAH